MTAYEIELPDGQRLRVGSEFLWHDSEHECVITEIDPEDSWVRVNCGLVFVSTPVQMEWPGARIVEIEREKGEGA